ncbi:hypothetical protein [Rathayibacter soli]|uniref:hypothetical protein n=1 Tax=Rathayibacter soli TaxID=3144168 RepID=UPI0027E407AE|nr:hypothetical protein [Glaciibacter superstes]
MSAECDDEAAVAGIRSLLRGAVEDLEAVHARDEALARFVPARRQALLLMRKSALIPIGRVWRLGVFLLGVSKAEDAATASDPAGGPAGGRAGAPADVPAGDGVLLYATGQTTRAVDPLYRGFQSVSAETRRDYRGAAFRGPFERGETVNFGATVIEMDAASLRSSSGPLLLRDGEARVRWAASIDAATVPFESYLAERVELLVHPPQGA